jgi:DNA topoisomerase-1
MDEDGQRRTITSGDVNAYLRETAGEEFTAKDFRTWAGTVLAARALVGKAPGSQTAARRTIVEAIRAVASRLGNTAAICRRCYVHPAVVDAYLGGTLDRTMRRAGRRRSASGLDAAERAVLPLLKARERRATGRAPAACRPASSRATG